LGKIQTETMLGISTKTPDSFSRTGGAAHHYSTKTPDSFSRTGGAAHHYSTKTPDSFSRTRGAHHYLTYANTLPKGKNDFKS